MTLDCNLENISKLNKISEIIIVDDAATINLDAEEDDRDYGYSNLSESQLVVNKYKLEPEGVQAVINFFKNCNSIVMTGYNKTTEFMKKYNLTADDCLEIIHKLTLSDYCANTCSFNSNFGGNNLVIFESKNIKLDNGKQLPNIVLYIKIDLDKTTNEAIAVVSMHEVSQNKLPYMNGEFDNIVEDYYRYKNYDDTIYDFLEELTKEDN